MSGIAQRRPMDFVAELGDWLEAGFPAFPGWAHGSIRIEDFMTDGGFVVRAELPGLDPDKDITVTVTNGMLVIEAERSEEEREQRYSEFRYGKYRRSVSLPAGAEQEKITARYENGILEVTVPIATEEAAKTGHRIPVTTG